MTSAEHEHTGGAASETAPLDDERLAMALEAALLTADKALPAGRLAQALRLESDGDAKGRIEAAVERLNEAYGSTGRAFRIEKVAGGYRVMTLPEFSDVVLSLRGGGSDGRLTRAGLETLAVIAYRQPVTRAEVEAIRGVGCGEVLRTLLERRLVDIAGRAEEPGRPLLYGTTKRFLEVFGLSTLKELPDPAEVLGPEAEA